MQEARLLGVDDYVTKPYDPPDLLVAIRSRLDRHNKIKARHADVVSQMKRSILTILNHEFRTPLTFVVAYADMLNDPNANRLSDAELLSFLKGISSGAERLRRLIENFIVLVELETGEATATFAWRKRSLDNLAAILEAAQREVCSRESVTHTCQIQIENQLPAIIGDEDYLRRAFIHLIENAVKFSPPEKPIRINARADYDEVVIEFVDQGRGIPAGELAKVWSSFYQINRELYEDQGTGSGLPIIKRIITLHGGVVDVESEVGVGTTFTVRLPVLLD
jgi:signal transduction histidine kinase